MELEAPEMPIFMPAFSVVTVQQILWRERQRRGSVVANVKGSWQRNAVVIMK